MARPKSALRKALEEKAAMHQAAAEATRRNNHWHSPTPTESTSGAASTLGSSGASTKEESQTPTPAATPDTNCTSPATQTSKPSTSYIASELERLSCPGITACNARDWEFTSPEAMECKEHVAPDFEAVWDAYPRPLTFWENIEGSRRLVEQDPNYNLEILNITSDVAEDEGEATVFLDIRVNFSNVQMKGLSELKWRRDEVGKWWCYRHTGMRMTEEHAGFV